METSVGKLIEILEKESQVYEDILKIAKNKTEVLVQGKVDELKNITDIEQALVLKVGKLEVVRDELIQEIAKQINQEAKHLTITDIIKLAAGDNKKQLKICAEKITKIVKQLNDTNHSNQELINQSLDYINFSINLLSSTHEGNTYSGRGESTKGEKKNFLDIKL